MCASGSLVDALVSHSQLTGQVEMDPQRYKASAGSELCSEGVMLSDSVETLTEL